MTGKLSDTLNLLSKLTWRRLSNMGQVAGSYLLSKWTKQARHWGSPISISFEPTTSCNLRCPECPSGLRSFTRPTGMLPDDLYKDTLDQLHKNLLYLIFYFQGEPYLHPRFLELVKYATRKKIYTATSTNAHYLSDENARKTIESGLDRIIISIDGTTQETYQAYRVGGSLNKVLEGTQNLIKWKKQLKSKTPFVVFQFLVVRPNEHQLAEVKQLAKEIGVDAVWFKTAQIYDYTQGSPLIPTIDYYSRYQNNGDGSYRIKNKLLNHCWRIWHSCVITWDGLVVPCCFDKDADYRLGDLKKEDFRTLWQGTLYTKFRQAVLQSRSQVEMCKNCTEGTKVWG
ncbi:SPASM domain-containing protein [Adhaeribacter radiodurans]|uniref:SPASM domain-containing protein n=1 Tax=Adhaeribacter radiodurans TaxID=2745197 RepID=A0A7L7LEL3_9BACT|nr:radical SAM protein [Adhaeribacter radiodurans]QMU30945.1 SPASM domain-containing protein [Adhaeribacter radiodurans]